MKKIKVLKEFRDKYTGKLLTVESEHKWEEDRVNAMIENHPGYIEVISEPPGEPSAEPPVEPPGEPSAEPSAEPPGEPPIANNKKK